MKNTDDQYVYVKKITIRNLERLKVGNTYFCRPLGNGIGIYLDGWTQFERYTISCDEFKEHFGTIREVRKEKLKKINESRG